jgi:eukaryotic-like serine/threonine-protein kinase
LNRTAWERAKLLLAGAAELLPADRQRFVADHCSDPELRREVLELLASPAPLTGIVAANVLQPGARLGPYIIDRLLGRGGMGEVYQALDTTLNRSVAIKVLPALVANDPERLARFRREAQILAALNHPNIAHIHGFEALAGVTTLVMELVNGPTLGDRIAHRGIPLDQALPLVNQIARALEAAHEQGIIHRDLKPANIKVREDGTVKLLDFGLASALDLAGPSIADVPVSSPTQTVQVTQAGLILGTAAYMAPEQAHGEATDKRADMWSFGCVLYEVLTGRRAFAGDTVTDTLSRVVSTEPDWTALPSNTPAPILRVLRQCLQKDRSRRLADIADARVDIEEALSRTKRQHDRRYLWTAVTAAMLLATSLTVWLWPRRDSAPAPLLASVVIELPAEWFILNQSPALSPDSRSIAFSALHQSGRVAIWLRPVRASSLRILADTDDGHAPFWSPAGDALGFFAQGKLKIRRMTDGLVRVLCDAPFDSTGTWISPDTILFAPDATSEVAEINVKTGAWRSITRLDTAAGELRHAMPMSLPNGRQFVYLSVRRDQRTAMLASVDGGQPVALQSVQSHVQTTASGHALFVDNGTLIAQRLDSKAGALTGEPTVLARELTVAGGYFDGRFSASPAMLVYLNAVARHRPPAELVVFDRAGQRIGTIGDPGYYTAPTFSPDGTRVAVARGDDPSPARDIWVFDLNGGTRTRVTLDPSDDLGPRWSSDGQWLTFSSNRRGQRDIYKHRASGEGPDEVVFESAVSKSVNAWSPDGRFIVYDTGGGGVKSDLHVLPLFGDRRPRVLSSTAGLQQQADISPDGRLIAYASSASGRYEVIVETFPEKGGVWQISTDGGSQPVWGPDGRELFFASGDTILSIDVRRSSVGLNWSAPRPMFRIANFQGLPRSLAVSPDGQRFVAVVLSGAEEPQRLMTLLNWTALVQ